MPLSVTSTDNENIIDSNRSKRPRSSLACIRCRKKKVKCDFLQPTCSRCSTSGLPCSYATPPRRVDGQAFDQLGNNVEQMKKRMRQMQSELIMLKSNLQPTIYDPSSYELHSMNSSTALTNPGSTMIDQHVTWKLTLSPNGLRIDTNIASVADLYRILLNGISQLNINRDSHGHLSNNSVDSIDNNFLSKSLKSIENGYRDTSTTRQLWEVDHHAASNTLRQETQISSLDDTHLPEETIDHLLHSYYHPCFLAYQIIDREEFNLQCSSTNNSDLLLINSIKAWMSKHSCIYHQCDNTKDLTTVGEAYFRKARHLLRARFDRSNATTIQALLNLYMYQLSCERSTLAYLYIGLAIRMAQDLKLHKKEYMVADLKLREKNKRLWWSAYWLDLCAALESNRPTMVDDKDCNIDYPIKMNHEDELTGYHIDFTVSSIKLMKIRKEITRHLPSEQAGQKLLSAISRLELTLMDWLQNLPEAIRYDIDEDSGDPVFRKKGNFCDEACLLLNIQYHTSWIMLHKGFLPTPGQTAAPVALLSQNICTKGANFITKLLEIYSQELDWCHFFYTLEGIVTSVNIHKVNVSSPERDVSENAKQNLLITSNIIQNSPLAYMDKAKEIVDSIHKLLKENNYHFNSKASALIVTSPASSTKGSRSNGKSNNRSYKKSTSTTTHQSIIPLHQPIYLQQYNSAYNYSGGSESSPAVSVTYLDNDIPSSPDPHKALMFTQQKQQQQQQQQHYMQSSTGNNNTTTTATTATTNIDTPLQYHHSSLSENILKHHQQDYAPFSNGIVLNDPTSSLMDLNLRNNNSNTNNGSNISQLLYRDISFEIEPSEPFYAPHHTTTATHSGTLYNAGHELADDHHHIQHGNSNNTSVILQQQQQQQQQHHHQSNSEMTNFLNQNTDYTNIYLYGPNMTHQTPYHHSNATTHHSFATKKRNSRDWEDHHP